MNPSKTRTIINRLNKIDELTKLIRETGMDYARKAFRFALLEEDVPLIVEKTMAIPRGIIKQPFAFRQAPYLGRDGPRP